MDTQGWIRQEGCKSQSLDIAVSKEGCLDLVKLQNTFCFKIPSTRRTKGIKYSYLPGVYYKLGTVVCLWLILTPILCDLRSWRKMQECGMGDRNVLIHQACHFSLNSHNVCLKALNTLTLDLCLR
jgi:hypothetical protein